MARQLALIDIDSKTTGCVGAVGVQVGRDRADVRRA
jgi:hypothetical protein